ncbi:hypothetical protein DMB42_41755 [Nonomuraea sp. WAC 01424]|uniref:hypothetical protein n=1 Tax=Nonomuraea sp. WAC 01424 TaxID=2203200 RepID=UPI000F7882BD|nr:hypothetical protein [Nonomuraea sp. WAC 01424]RSM99441.1 hypothetical protein DMB42_41755 [Nonomuraea sp. WAC 01424]
MRGGRGHTRDCPALATDDVLRQCARPGCGRAKPDREPGKGGRPSKYCCKLCGNEASRAADSAHADRQTAVQERDAALHAQREALNAQHTAEEHRDRIHAEARADAERLGVQIGNLTTRLNDEQLVTTRQAEQLSGLAADLSRAQALAEERAAALAERALALVERDRQLDQADAAAEQARAETRAARDTLSDSRRRFEEERDQLRTQHDQARLGQATAETRLEMAERELRILRHQLAAAQAATGLVVPPLADVEGRPGVRLPGGAFDAVTLRDGVVVLHHAEGAIPLGDASQSPAQARALSAALQAALAPPPA